MKNQNYIMDELWINAGGRYMIKNQELHCGDCVQLYLCGKWIKTRIEAYEGEYYFDGLPGLKPATLLARIKKA